ncbi:MAG: hypothetical protein WD080_01285 [Egibacteraceae bacterium]
MRFELLTDRHQTAGFSCGDPALDSWLVEHALVNQARSLSRTFVATHDTPADSEGQGTVVGYVTLVAAAIEVPHLPSGERRGLVGLDQMGAALIARLARDQRHTHRGLGAWLLQQALHRVLDADQHLAIRAVIVDALNDRAAAWWSVRPPVAPIKRVRASLDR